MPRRDHTTDRPGTAKYFFLPDLSAKNGPAHQCGRNRSSLIAAMHGRMQNTAIGDVRKFVAAARDHVGSVWWFIFLQIFSSGLSMAIRSDRRQWLRGAGALAASGAVGLSLSRPRPAMGAAENASWETATQKALAWLSRTQSSRGHWNTQVYPTALAALAGKGERAGARRHGA